MYPINTLYIYKLVYPDIFSYPDSKLSVSTLLTQFIHMNM